MRKVANLKWTVRRPVIYFKTIILKNITFEYSLVINVYRY